MRSFRDWHEQNMESPEYALAYQSALERQAREIRRLCWVGCCVEFYDPVEKEVTGGWGPVGCLCQVYKHPIIVETPEGSRIHSVTRQRYKRRKHHG